MGIISNIAVRLGCRLLKNGIRSGGLNAASRRRLKSMLGVLSNEARRDICHQVIETTGRVVTAGPFQGMKISQTVSWGDGDILPKYLGCYEAELAPFFDEIQELRFDFVVNVGTAEGFYAVGSAMVLNTDRVIAVDIDQAALDVTKENADLNGVGQKLQGMLGLDAEGLCELVSTSNRCLIISDCEGFELELFSDRAIGALKGSYCLVECHEFIGEKVTETLTERFSATHNVEIVEEGARNPNQVDLLRSKSSLDRWLAISEGRPETMGWLIARPKPSI